MCSNKSLLHNFAPNEASLLLGFSAIAFKRGHKVFKDFGLRERLTERQKGSTSARSDGQGQSSCM